MATLENNLDTVPCRHCGSPVRPGMIRCRECRGLLSDTADEFTLSPTVAVLTQPKCPRCGTALEAGVADCPGCASALLDDLLKGPAEAEPGSVRLTEPVQDSSSRSELRPWQGDSSRPASGTWAPLLEIESDPNLDVKQDAKRSARPGADAPPQRRSQSPKKSAGPPKSRGPASSAPSKSRSTIEDDPPGLFGDDDEYSPKALARSSESARPEAAPTLAPASSATAPEGATDSGVETSAACTALLASLAAADANLRIEIATALGKLGDKAALAPLERHLIDQDVRVRRAVASALVQLGHPKGETLLDIAERKPASDVLSSARPGSTPRPKAKRHGNGISGDTLKKLAVALVAIAVAGGGIWYFTSGNSGSSGRTRRSKKKSTATKKATAADLQTRQFPVG